MNVVVNTVTVINRSKITLSLGGRGSTFIEFDIEISKLVSYITSRETGTRCGSSVRDTGSCESEIIFFRYVYLNFVQVVKISIAYARRGKSKTRAPSSISSLSAFAAKAFFGLFLCSR